MRKVPVSAAFAAFAAVAATVLAAPSALAQEATTGGGTTGSVDTAATVTTPAKPVVAAASAEKDDNGISDHDKVVRKFAIGYLGFSRLPLAGETAGTFRGSLDTPVIGARYWMSEKLGIDVGLGFGTTFGGSTSKNNNVETTTSSPAALGVAVHGGVPLVLGHHKHYKLLVIPELNFGFTTRSVEQANQPTVHLGGWRLDVGARAGAEIHFGFIGVPQLSLQGTVGLAFQHQTWSASRDAFGTTTESSQSTSQNGIGTSLQSDPWALFTNNISALYYFP
jgi:hypothetical protein